ncbi:leucyl aminopeptidase family protein [Candidatus Cytomitobacter primus]|uniref:Leucyl aminopeptidase n=1 Tax=Candidatus Cytomitobacter primus TaxID=2066024 RepID=A0A5C0UEC9_9PROT|nr:leucyl aminopeptidase [Candidatus Cytomitobacter primus]QEK38446.1 leucyl aminopeptidase [Candidatus Cytomitobacter primus]
MTNTFIFKNFTFRLSNQLAQQSDQNHTILKIIQSDNVEKIYNNETEIKYFTKKPNDILLGIEIGKYIQSIQNSIGTNNHINNGLNNTNKLTIDCSHINKYDLLKFYEGLLIGIWEYSGHKTNQKPKNKISIDIYFKDSVNTNTPHTEDLQENMHEEIQKINNLIDSTFLTRELVEMPSNLLTPSKLAEYAKNIPGIKVTIEKVTEGGIWEVGKGSSEPPLLITCEWDGTSYNNSNIEGSNPPEQIINNSAASNSSNPNNKHNPIVLVGKGVTFDSGGLSLKPPRSMEDMKVDMGGAATVLGIMKAAASNKLKQKLIAIIPCVENMPSGNALKPGDVITSLSGKTIEVLNTDAEGRLILADALYIAQTRYKASKIIDFATLTGAVVVALGELYGGLFSNDTELSNQLIESGDQTHEPVCRLPLNDKYDELMNCHIADMCNIAKPGAGAGSITAAQFLQRFIDKKTKWAHIDIAGVAHTSRNSMLNINKSTGFGVRLVCNYLSKI